LPVNNKNARGLSVDARALHRGNALGAEGCQVVPREEFTSKKAHFSAHGKEREKGHWGSREDNLGRKKGGTTLSTRGFLTLKQTLR